MNRRVATTLGVVILVLSACKANGPLVSSEPSPSPSASRSASPSSTPSPTQSPLTGPPAARFGAALEFDPVSQQLLLIGGAGDNVPVRDFWAWRPDGGWRALTPDIVPAAGYLSLMVWDPALRETLLLTDQGSGAWAWDGTTWAGAIPVPLLSDLSGAAYDSGHHMVLVLGQAFSVSPQPASAARGAYQGEAMWSWDGTGWNISPTPMSPRLEAGVAYDTFHGQLVVYGGFGDGDNTTWLWDGANWKGVHTHAAPMANQSSAAYDPVRREVVMFGPGGETWTWDGSNWTIRSTSGPGIRRDQSMAFDAAIGQVVLFGGKSPEGQSEVAHDDLWGWDGTRWNRLA